MPNPPWDLLGPFSTPVVVYSDPLVPGAAGDPSVIFDPGVNLYRMVLTGIDLNWVPQETAILEFTSPDGLVWTPVDSPLPAEGTPGLILTPGPTGAWDQTGVEVANLVRVSATEYRLYYSDSFAGQPTQSGVALSSDSLTFTRYAGNPIIRSGATDPDAFLAQHPVVFREGPSLWRMVYTGDPEPGDPANHSSICAATSSDGLTWTKLGRILGRVPGNSFMAQGVSECGAFFKWTDGFYYVLFTGFIGTPFTSAGVGIGIARSATFPNVLGGWTVNPLPLLVYNSAPWNAGGVVTPTARIEGTTMRIWFTGHNADFTAAAIGHSTGNWPF